MVLLGHCTGQCFIPQGPQSFKRSGQTLWTILQNAPLKTSGLTWIINTDILLFTVLHSILHLRYLPVWSLTLCYPRKCAEGVCAAAMMVSLYRKEEFLLQLSGSVLYFRSRSLFHAILTLSQPLISGLPHPSAVREHPTYSYSGKLSLLCFCNNKAHVETVNGESNQNPQNSLHSKTTSMHWALCSGSVHV